MFLAGEWVTSNLMFGAAFVVAGIGVFALAYYVLRGDRQNRALLEAQEAQQLVAPQGQERRARRHSPAAGAASQSPAPAATQTTPEPPEA